MALILKNKIQRESIVVKDLAKQKGRDVIDVEVDDAECEEYCKTFNPIPLFHLENSNEFL